MQFLKKNNLLFFRKRSFLSVLVILLVTIITTWNILNVKYWKKNEGIIYWDTLSYYSYLPATFIYKDLSLKFIDEDNSFFSNKFWPEITENKTYVIRTSMGMAILYLPFFTIAHVVSKPMGFPADGFSMPYHVSLAFSGIFYLTIGLFFLRKLLLRYYKDHITALTIFIVVFATNLFFYTSVTATMSHSFNFALISIFMWCSVVFLKKPSFSGSFSTGLLFGIITLVRPSNVIIILIPLLYGIRSYKDFIARIFFFLKNYRYTFIIITLTILIWLPQMFYWKSLTGSWLYNSYGSHSRFFWLEPMLREGLFGFRKGWLIYTPVMIFAIAGFLFIKKNAGDWLIVIPVITVLAIYIILSWWCWWYGGGFGMRPMIDYYPLLSIPLAAFITFLYNEKKLLLKYSLIIAFALSAGLGLFHFQKYYHGSIHWDSMTKEAYLKYFWHIHPDSSFDEYLITPDYGKAIKEREK